jgi:hypothetical protein
VRPELEAPDDEQRAEPERHPVERGLTLQLLAVERACDVDRHPGTRCPLPRGDADRGAVVVIAEGEVVGHEGRRRKVGRAKDLEEVALDRSEVAHEPAQRPAVGGHEGVGVVVSDGFQRLGQSLDLRGVDLDGLDELDVGRADRPALAGRTEDAPAKIARRRDGERGGELGRDPPHRRRDAGASGVDVEGHVDGGELVDVEGVEGPGGEGVVVAVHVHRTTPSLPSVPSSRPSRAMPRRKRDFTVPSGMPRRAATSRWVRPS